MMQPVRRSISALSPNSRNSAVGMPLQRQRRAGHDHRRAVVAAHGVERDANLLRHGCPEHSSDGSRRGPLDCETARRVVAQSPAAGTIAFPAPIQHLDRPSWPTAGRESAASAFSDRAPSAPSARRTDARPGSSSTAAARTRRPACADRVDRKKQRVGRDPAEIDDAVLDRLRRIGRRRRRRRPLVCRWPIGGISPAARTGCRSLVDDRSRSDPASPRRSARPCAVTRPVDLNLVAALRHQMKFGAHVCTMSRSPATCGQRCGLLAFGAIRMPRARLVGICDATTDRTIQRLRRSARLLIPVLHEVLLQDRRECASIACASRRGPAFRRAPQSLPRDIGRRRFAASVAACPL